MNMYIRFLILIFKRTLARGPMDVFDPCVTRFRVNPFDLDINLHMNNGRYLSIMDLGRMDLMLRAGVFWRLMLRGYYPVVVSESIRFRRSLDPFQSFEVITVIEAWDEKDFFMTQKFVRKGVVVAEGYIKARFRQRGRNGSLPTAETFELMGKALGGAKTSDLSNAQNRIESMLALKG
jgi:acyl-CoA thioesterase FadM